MAMIQIKNVTKKFGSVVAVDNLSLDVEAGRLDQRPADERCTPQKRNIGIVFQDCGVSTVGGDECSLRVKTAESPKSGGERRINEVWSL